MTHKTEDFYTMERKMEKQTRAFKPKDKQVGFEDKKWFSWMLWLGILLLFPLILWQFSKLKKN